MNKHLFQVNQVTIYIYTHTHTHTHTNTNLPVSSKPHSQTTPSLEWR